MSQDQPKQPESEDITPNPSENQPSEQRSTPTSPPESRQSAQPTSTQAQLQQFWRQVQPVLQTQGVKALKVTIRALKRVVNKLETQRTSSPTKTPSFPDESPGNVISATGATPEIQSDELLDPAEVNPAEESSPKISPPPASKQPAIAPPATSPSLGSTFSITEVLDRVRSILVRLRPLWEKFQTYWNLALTKLRTFLPENWNAKLSDRAFSGIVAGTLILLLWITSGLFSGKPTKVAQAPSQRTTPTDLTAPPELTAPDPEQPISIVPSAEPSPVTTPSSAPVPIPVGGPSSTPIPSPKAVPTPRNLTPEQSLIAAIQDQVAEITSQYADGLIQSIQANFQGSRLIVKVGDHWFDLAASRQDQLANEILQRAKELNFNRLEITDPQGELLARSPVVGPNMIILQRT